MKKIILFVCLLALLIVPLVGCMPEETPAPPLPAKSGQDDGQNAEIKALNEAVTKLQQASTPDIYTKSQIDQKIAEIPNSDTYTKDQVDSKLRELQDQIDDIDNSGGSSGGSGGSSTGSVNFTTNPASVPQLFTATSGSQSTFYTVRIINNSSTWQYVKPIITLSLASSYTATTVNSLTVNMNFASYNLTAADLSYSPIIGTTSTTSMVIIPIAGGTSGSGEFQVGAGQTIDVLVQINNFNTSTTVLWNITTSISSRQI